MSEVVTRTYDQLDPLAQIDPSDLLAAQPVGSRLQSVTIGDLGEWMIRQQGTGGRFFPLAAEAHIPRGVVGYGAITPGAGGSNGVFTASLTGGNFAVNPIVRITVAAGALSAVEVVAPGEYIGAAPVAPLINFGATSAGLAGAACALTVGDLIASGERYFALNAAATHFRQYQNVAGVPALVAPEISLPTIMGMEALVSIAEAVNGPNFSSQAEGEAETPLGSCFAVNVGGIVSVYLRTVGGSTFQRAIATTAALASTAGTALVGMAQPAGARTRTLASAMNDVVRLKDFHGGNGTNANAAIAAAIAHAQAIGVSRIVAASGHYLASAVSLPAGITLEGDGDSTLFEVAANNANIFTANAADNITLRGLRMKGDGTASSTANGCGLSMAMSAGLLIEDATFEDFGSGPLLAKNISATRRKGPHLSRVKVRGTAAASFVDIFVTGAWDGSLFEDMNMVCASARAILVADEGVGLWRSVEVRGGWFQGYTMFGVAVSDEAWDGTDRVYGFSVNGGYYRDIGSAAIKAKLSKGIAIDGATVEACGATPENAPSGLYGAILCNSIGDVAITNCKLKGVAGAGIVTNGNDGYPDSLPSGFGMGSYRISDNQIEGVTAPVAATGDGIVHLGHAKSYIATGNQVRAVARHGLRASCPATGLIQHITLAKNHLLDSPDSLGYGVFIEKAGIVSLAGNHVHNFKANCVVVENAITVTVASDDQAGDSATASRCYTFTSCRNVFFGGKAICTFYSGRAASTAYAVGDRAFIGSDVVECVTAGNTDAGAAPALVGGQAVDGTVRWVAVHKYRMNNGGVHFGGTAPQLSKIEGTARFDYLVGPGVDGPGVAGNLRHDVIASGTVNLAAGAAAVAFGTPDVQPNATYKVRLQGYAAEIFTPSARAVGGFTINSNNASSTASVDWVAYR